MEDEKKKKRNKKKKKNKAITHGEDHVPPSTDHSHVPHSHHSHLDSVESESVTDTDKGKCLTNESNVEDKEKAASCIPKEAMLEETIKKLRDENDAHLQKVAVLEETVRCLKNENEAHILKEATLEERILHLRKENDMFAQQMCSLEDKMKQLLDEKSAYTQNEVSLEEKIRQLERDRESWWAMERSSKETISNMDDEVTRLQAQVLDLEESRNNLLNQNNSLMGTVSDLQVQIKNYEKNLPSANTPDGLKKEASTEELNSQIEAACTLVEKLITENADLVEKVNELCIKLNQQNMLHRVSSSNGSDSLPFITDTTKVDEGHQKPECLEEIPIHDEVIHSNSNGITRVKEAAFQVGEIEETVPVSMNPNGDLDVEAQVIARENEEAVPITDAPLIGAPFRLVSFVARYVSGSDLVEKNTLISRY